MIKVINKTSAILLQNLYREGSEFFDLKAVALILNDRDEASMLLMAL
jgi:hypothetical protein